MRQHFSGIAEVTVESSVWDAPVVSLLPRERAIYACPDPLEFGTFQACSDFVRAAGSSSKQQEQQAQTEEMLRVWTSAVMQAEESVPRFKLAQGDILFVDNFRCERPYAF